MSARRIGAAQTALIFLGVMAGLAIIGAGVGLLLQWAAAKSQRPEPHTLVQARLQTPPEPLLQVDPLADRQVILGPERRASTWGWTDKARARAHIPVEAAMQRLAESGWPEPGAGR